MWNICQLTDEKRDNLGCNWDRTAWERHAIEGNTIMQWEKGEEVRYRREERDSIAVGIHTDGNIMRSKGISCGRRKGKLTERDGEDHPKMGLQVGCRDRIRPMGGRRACDREQWKKNHATWVYDGKDWTPIATRNASFQEAITPIQRCTQITVWINCSMPCTKHKRESLLEKKIKN